MYLKNSPFYHSIVADALIYPSTDLKMAKTIHSRILELTTLIY